MAGLAPSDPGLAQRRLLDPAALHAPGAALAEGAAGRQALQIGRLARDRAELLGLRLVEAGRRAQQPLRIGMLRLGEELGPPRLLPPAGPQPYQDAVPKPRPPPPRLGGTPRRR